VPAGARGVEKGERDMHLYGTKRDRSESVVCCFPLYKLIFFTVVLSEDCEWTVPYIALFFNIGHSNRGHCP
jgi:hypothetical protein